MQKVIRNSAKCLLCETEIVSKHRHDFVRCKCGDVFVDGGNVYIRRGGNGFFSDPPTAVDTSITED